MSTRDDPVDLPSAGGRTECCPAESPVGERAESAATAIVLPIRPRSTGVDGAPLFCLAGEAALAWNYVGLVAHLDHRVPIYGLQAGAEPRTIGEYAARYLTEIRRIAPHGPYQLLGWSVGGVIAHELAVRLRAAGEHVRVVLLATDAPAPLTADRFAPLLGAPSCAAPTDASATAAASTAAAINTALAGTIDLTDSDLTRLTEMSNTAAGMLNGHRPSWLPGDLTVCVAGRDLDGTDRLDPGATVRHWRPNVEGAVTGYVLDATPDELTAPDLLAEIARILATTPSSARTTC
ncbi:thioesterase domain-containing protein [Nocardia sp. NPDC058633]|uniref:thioesterase domain-containing protein n=1 Tax=Nocardia sp. NPDC058633 TaxID=3346568 RepID=UPI003647CE34